MDAVPGTPTTLWFTPKYTTDEMKKKLGNPDFVYEISPATRYVRQGGTIPCAASSPF